jgi:diguanylate cyclase (GGDEF)-like protein
MGQGTFSAQFGSVRFQGIDTYKSRPFRVTISLGVSTTDGSAAISVQELIHQADEKLYQAKRAGRNCLRA